MGKGVYEASGAAKETYELANKVLGIDLSALCFGGPEERLNQTDMSQPAIFTTSVASFRAGVAAGKIDPATVTSYAGLSLGEYTALHLAGVFDFETGLKLVAARGRLMQAAADANPSGMVAIMGADHAAVDRLCAECADEEVLVPANYNAPGQVVVSGGIFACQRIQAAAEAAGYKAAALKVAGAFHSPLMESAAKAMTTELEGASFSAPAKAVWSNVSAELHDSVASIKIALIAQIVRPVKWEQIMTKLAADAGGRFVELAPGRTLAGLAKRINRRLPIESFAGADALA